MTTGAAVSVCVSMQGGATDKTIGTADAVVCLAASDKFLVVGRASGTVHRYTLPHISLTDKYVLRCRPQQLALNCDSTRMSIIDINGILSFFDLDTRKADVSGKVTVGEHLSYERKVPAVASALRIVVHVAVVALSCVMSATELMYVYFVGVGVAVSLAGHVGHDVGPGQSQAVRSHGEDPHVHLP
jgi:hypothetical protein